MPVNKVIEVGTEFSSWTVIRSEFRRCWCRCVCGREKYVSTANLVYSRSTQCGSCANQDCWPWDDNKHPLRLRLAVHHAISRCTKTTHRQYADYGGRGIKVHELWVTNRLLFVEYLASLDGCVTPGLRLDRINNDGHYEPGNLRFVDASMSNYNRRKRCVK